MRYVLSTVAVLGAALAICGSDASAQTRHKRVVVAAYDTDSLQSLPLTVNRRSWLDPGPASTAQRGPSYVAATTQFSRDQQQIINPDRFGNDVLQGQPYVPGRTVPVVEFSTLPAGGVSVDNTIGYQNYAFDPAAPQVPSEPAVVPFLQQEQ